MVPPWVSSMAALKERLLPEKLKECSCQLCLQQTQFS